MENRSQKKKGENEQQADKEDHKAKNPFDRHTFEKLKTTEALELLDIHTATQQCSKAFRDVRGDLQWVELFKSGHFQKAKEFLLHVAVQLALDGESSGKEGDVTSRLLPQITDVKMIECMLSRAMWKWNNPLPSANEKYLEFGKAVCRLCDYSPDDYIKNALGKKRWDDVLKLMSIYTPPQTIIDTVLQAAIDNGNFSLMADCVKHNCDKRLLHIALIKSLGSRERGVLNNCHLQGEDIAALCAETGFDLNAKRGEKQATLLQDALDDYWVDITAIEKLLDAGADPDPQFSNGETAVGQAIKRAHCRRNWGEGERARTWTRWNLVILLLKHSTKDEGETLLNQMYDGQTALHAVCIDGLADTLLTLVKMKANPLVRNSSGETLMMTAMDLPLPREAISTFTLMDTYERRENTIKALILVGVSTHQAVVSRSLLSSDIATQREFAFRRSPMIQAVKQCHLRLAKLLYASGACSYKEIYELSNVVSTMNLSEPTLSRLMLDFVHEISSHPRSLLNTCALTISHLIGCGAERESRAANTGLPEALRRLVLHDHVIDPDFLKDTPEPERTVPALSYQTRPFQVPICGGCGFREVDPRWKCGCLEDN